MDKEIKHEYLERLISPNNSKTYFIEQCLQGSGSELGGKFWSNRSSSRLCFDLYSWLCNESRIKGFQFEKKLPGVLVSKNKTGGVPNMDAYFEKDNKIFFIESKYTESDKWKYKSDKGSDGKFHLSAAYWLDEPYGRSSINLEQRFYDCGEIGNRFSELCFSIQDEINKAKKELTEGYSWFDPKQETCHLFGIIFYVLSGGQEIIDTSNSNWLNPFRNKHIILNNIVWRCEDSNDIINSDKGLVNAFKQKAEKLLGDIFKEYSTTFSFEVYAIQEILKDGLDGIKFNDAELFANKDHIKVIDYILKDYKETKR